MPWSGVHHDVTEQDAQLVRSPINFVNSQMCSYNIGFIALRVPRLITCLLLLFLVITKREIRTQNLKSKK